MTRVMDDGYEVQPEDGLCFSSSGNYGSTVFDPIADMSTLEIVICDDCVTKAGRDGIVRLSQPHIGIAMDIGHPGIFAAGYYSPGREPVVWEPGKQYPEQEYLTVEPEDVAGAKELHSTIMWKASAVKFAREFLAAESEEEATHE